MAPHVVAAGAPVAADRDLERRGTSAQRLVRQTPDHGVTRRSLAAATVTPLIRRHHAVREHGALWLESLTDGHEPKLIESAEHGQVRTGEAGPRGSVRHVEVFQMGSVRTSILGRPRPLPRDRRRLAAEGVHTSGGHMHEMTWLSIEPVVAVVERNCA